MPYHLACQGGNRRVADVVFFCDRVDFRGVYADNLKGVRRIFQIQKIAGDHSKAIPFLLDNVRRTLNIGASD